MGRFFLSSLTLLLRSLFVKAMGRFAAQSGLGVQVQRAPG